MEQRRSLTVILVIVTLLLQVVVVKVVDANELHVHDPRRLIKENYGVIFQEIRSIDNSASAWYHTIDIPLIVHEDIKKVQNYCTGDPFGRINLLHKQIYATFCMDQRLVLYETYHLHEKLWNDTMLLLDVTDDMLPNTSGPRTRVRRAILDFIGDISYTLFGTAKASDVHLLRKQVQLMLASVIKNKVTNIQLLQDLHSYQLGINKRDDIQSKMIRRNRALINRTIEAFESYRSNLSDLNEELNKLAEQVRREQMYARVIFSFKLHNVNYLADAKSTVQQQLDAVNTLRSGHLSYYFVPPIKLRKILMEIDVQLKMKYPTFKIAYNHPNYYYQSTGVTVLRAENHIYIKIKIPLVTSGSRLTLYRIKTIPVPTHARNSKGYTGIKNLPQYFGVTQDQVFYTEVFDDKFLETCDRRKISSCTGMLPLRDKHILTCASALYFDDQKKVKELCDLVYYPKGSIHTSDLLDLGNGYVLVRTEDTSFVKICQGRPPVPIVSCSYCIIKLPCGCALRTSVFYIPSTLRHCPHITTTTMYHAINLLYAYQFFNWSILQDVTPHSLKKVPWNWNLPEVKVNQRQFNGLIAQEKKTVYDLKKTSAGIRKDVQVYGSVTDILAEQIEYLEDQRTPRFYVLIPMLNLFLIVLLCTVLLVHHRRTIQQRLISTVANKLKALNLDLKPMTLRKSPLIRERVDAINDDDVTYAEVRRDRIIDEGMTEMISDKSSSKRQWVV